MPNEIEEHRRRNPKETANFLSWLCFGWTLPIFMQGRKRSLQLKDLYDPLKSNKSGNLGNRLEREWKKELATFKNSTNKGSKCQPSLKWALIRMFWVPFMLQGMLFLVLLLGLKIMQPICQGWVIGYFNPGENSISQNQGLLNAGALILVTLALILIEHHNRLRTQEIGMCIRIACCSLIYRKLLRLNLTAVKNAATGKVANLISNDVARFDMLLIYLHFVWIMPLQMSLIGYVMWQSLGVATLVGMVAMLVQTLPIQGYLSHVGGKLRSKIAVKTDERVQLIREIIAGIQVVKMYTWEKPFETILWKIRGLELKLIAYWLYLRGILLGLMNFSGRITVWVTMVTFVLMGNSLTPEIVFPMITFFNVLQMTCGIAVPAAIIQASEAAVSLKRITDFLLMDEVGISKNSESKANESVLQNNEHQTESPLLQRDEGVEKIDESTSQKEEKELKSTVSRKRFEHGIEIELLNVNGNWIRGQLPPTLSDVSMEIKSQSLSVVVGPVGSGKSSLLQLLLGELSVGAGQLSFFTGQDNEKIRINSRDICMSYTSQEPWLFSGSIRDNILFGQPYDENRYQEVIAACVLDKDFQQLPHGDLSFVGERGAILSGGQRARVNLARAIYKDADLYLLDDPLSAVDAPVARHLFEECIKGFLKGKTRILATHQLQFLQQADDIIIIDRGTIKSQGKYDKIVEAGRYFEANKFPEENVQGKASCKSAEKPKVSENEKFTAGKPLSQIFKSYFLSGGHICSLILLGVTFIIGQVATNASDYWLTYWTNHNTVKAVEPQSVNFIVGDQDQALNNSANMSVTSESAWFDEFGLLRTNVAIEVYTALILANVLILFLRSLHFMKICMNASRNIHKSMFYNLLLAPMRFFNINPAGRVLNRFSKDVGAMDELLPKAILEALQIFTVILGIFVIVAIIIPLAIIPAVIMCGLMYFVTIYFLRVTRDIRRLEGMTKSPVFSQISSTLDGLTTIRSRGTAVEEMMVKEFDRHQDVNTGAWYLTIATATAFGFTLDLISCFFTAFVCFSLIFLNDGNFLGGSVGLAISQCLTLTGLVQYGIRLFAMVVAQMISVERVLQYTNLPKEKVVVTDKPPPADWPCKGGLVFKGVSMKYADDEPPVLKNLNFNIKPGWKVGIVGRTGAGKSSLISALFRLTGDGLEGEILLDEIDTMSIGLHDLRSRISVIPQEPVLFSASLRYNLDPFNRYSDSELWDSLREVELGNLVSSLDFQVAEGGANFSIGQRQLICLARAILRNNRLIVLDEATANIDRITDALIQTTIRRRFSDSTVLTIAHQIKTIMDSDRVLVIDGGCIVEFGPPHLLLKDPNGFFTQMLQQTGMTTSKILL
ncbi:ATP-binding cassette sub-family C member 4-like [Neodiprion fabricii]|uniref:ATP-binding cassette sub-family C member 4-like n=1 Tax=Neodiprion fabricii TaxID=2872261 RepID=UPI001ED96E72|nr:ATP-binding cassette sub-family C member 4-like [Neodiprion fabricii]